MKSEKTDVVTESKSSANNVITGLVIFCLMVVFVKNRKKFEITDIYNKGT